MSDEKNDQLKLIIRAMLACHVVYCFSRIFDKATEAEVEDIRKQATELLFGEI